MRNTDEFKNRGSFSSQSFDDIFRKIGALRTLLPRKINWRNPKQVEPEVLVSTKAGGSVI